MDIVTPDSQAIVALPPEGRYFMAYTYSARSGCNVLRLGAGLTILSAAVIAAIWIPAQVGIALRATAYAKNHPRQSYWDGAEGSGDLWAQEPRRQAPVVPSQPVRSRHLRSRNNRAASAAAVRGPAPSP